MPKDPLKDRIPQLIQDLNGLSKPERIRELVITVHLYTNYFLDRILKGFFLYKVDDKAFQEEVLDRISFLTKIELLKDIIKQYGLEKVIDKKEIIFGNMKELNINRNRMAHNLDLETLTFCGREKRIEDCVEDVNRYYVPVILEHNIS